MNGERHSGVVIAETDGSENCGQKETRTRVFVAAENRLLQDTLCRMFAKRNDVEVVGATSQSGLIRERCWPSR